jgi:hypothetical protein
MWRKEMTTCLKILVASVYALFLCAGSAFATNITIWDGNPWNETINGNMEDNECEPGMVQAQIWDLEAFIFEGTTLTMIGGYNFETGVDGLTSGDLFISLSEPVYGDINGTNGISTVYNTYGYDYAIDLTGAFFELDENSQLRTAYYWQNEGSSPWQVDTTFEDVDGSLAVSYLSNAEVMTYVNQYGLSGWGNNETHYGVSFDLSGLNLENQEFWAHFTMECGNDNLMGHAAPVPEPATMLLLGTGLIGLAGISRRKMKK